MSDGMIRVVGDGMILRQINETKPSKGISRFPANRAVSQSDYWVAAYLDEQLLKACEQSSAKSKYEVEGPIACGLTLSSENENIAIDTVVAKDVAYATDDSAWTVHRVHEDLGVVYPAEPWPDLSQRRCIAKPAAVLIDVAWYGFGEIVPPAAGSTTGLDSLIGIQSGHRCPLVVKVKNRAARQGAPRFPNIASNLGAFIRHHADDCIVVISVEELRSTEGFVSMQVSWERTIQTTLDTLASIVMKEQGELHDQAYLKWAKHIVVTFGPEATLYVRRGTEGRRLETSGPLGGQVKFTEGLFVFCPKTIEEDLINRFPGRMSGFDTCTSVAITHSLTHDPPKAGQPRTLLTTLTNALIRGLRASRFLQVHGHDHIPSGLDTSPLKGIQPEFDPTVAGREFARQCQATERLQWIFPIGLTSQIIAHGNIEHYQWYPHDVEKQERGAYRQHFERLHREWRDCDRVFCHHLSPEVMASISKPNRIHVPSTASNRDYSSHASRTRAYFDDTWWTLLGSTARDAACLATPEGLDDDNPFFPNRQEAIRNAQSKYLPKKSRDEEMPNFRSLMLRLAREVLIFGENWLIEDTPLAAARREIALYEALAPSDKGLTAPPGYDAKKTESSLRTVACAIEDTPSNLWLYKMVPFLRLGGLWTVDRREIESLRNVSGVLRAFFHDRSSTRPLNIGVFGPPGAGKSTAIKEIIKNLPISDAKYSTLSRNLSQFSSPEQLIEAFNEIQDVGLSGALPVVFWDEFDATYNSDAYGWLKYFIGPMNDGEYFDRDRTRRLPKCVFVFAASTLHSFAKIQELEPPADLATRRNDPKDQPISPELKHRIDQWSQRKGPDFKSRLACALDVLGVNPPPPFVHDSAPRELPSEHYGYLFRRAAVLRYNLRLSFDKLFDPSGVLAIDSAAANAFLRIDQYYYGARSIEKIVGASSVGSRGRFDVSCLPPASLLRLHVDEVEFERHYVSRGSSLT